MSRESLTNTSPRRVLQIIGGRSVGGVGTVLLNYLEAIDRSRLQFDFVLHADGDRGNFDEKVRALGAQVFLLPPLRVGNIFKILSGYIRLFRSRRGYAAVHLHSAQIAFLIYPLARLLGVPRVVIHSHNTRYSDFRLRSIRNWILCRGLKLHADAFVACSESAGSFMFGQEMVQSGSVYIMRNAIDCERFAFRQDVRDRTRSELNLGDRLVVGHVGRFVPQKNHQFLLRVFECLLELEPSAVLLLAGPNDQLHPEIVELSRELAIDRSVKFLGFRSDVADLFQAFDVFVLPSLYEGLPMVAVEAQASGLPCVMADTITREAMASDLAQFLSLDLDPTRWAGAVLQAARSTTRRNRAGELSQSGFDVHQEAQRLNRFYEALEGYGRP